MGRPRQASWAALALHQPHRAPGRRDDRHSAIGHIDFLGNGYVPGNRNATSDCDPAAYGGTPPAATPAPTATPTATATPVTPTPVVGKVIFSSDRSGYAHIFTVRGNGQGLRAITGGNEYFWDPVLSNDGTLAAYVSKVNGNTEVFVARSDGSNVRPISNHPAEDDHPAWFPNNGALAFASRRDGGWDIYRMNADGSNVHRLTWDSGDNRFVAVSLEGDRIAHMSQNTGYPTIER
ncbi:MAG: PD40 domain-containing protein [Anaerolineae bacterium]|nr:MAG: PD40 domain-containing protein [Anaerolineae bacterium]